MRRPVLICLLVVSSFFAAKSAVAQTLEQRLLAEPVSSLVDDAFKSGDAKRGAIVFHQPFMACVTCHSEKSSQQRIGPDLANLQPKPSDEELIESVLRPSSKIRKGFESVTVVTTAGRVITGILVSKTDQQLVIRDAGRHFEQIQLQTNDIEEVAAGTQSIMPTGQVNVLASRQQFLDLVAYLIEIRDGGPDRARELQPPAALLAAAPLSEYEKQIDHAGMIRDLDNESLERGEAIFERVCANCHGTLERQGSLPTSLKFATGKFRNGSDPYTMYQTLTRGFGLMIPQSWMVPQQKYDVIHYIRETYLKPHNSSQLFTVTDEYLNSLPKGDTRGPEPKDFQPWRDMDYGANLVATYEIGNNGSNFAYKGNAVRLDAGPGGVSRGKSWMLFDYDTLRMAAAWSGDEFIDYNGINFNGRHAIHPRVVGTVHLENQTGPGWARPGTDSFEDVRLVGRDERRYGPLPRNWAQYKGMYHHSADTIVSYTVGKTSVLETFSQVADSPHVFARHFEIGPREQDMLLRVAQDARLTASPIVPLALTQDVSSSVTNSVTWQAASTGQAKVAAADMKSFDGSHYLQIEDVTRLNMNSADYTIHARVKTTSDGTIFCLTKDAPKWIPNGKSFFIRGGRLTFDIGWVGAVQSDRRVNDNKWHDVAVTFDAARSRLQFFIDGQAAGGGNLQPQENSPKYVGRIGFTASNFPGKSPFKGSIDHVRFFDRKLSPQEIAGSKKAQANQNQGLVAEWKPAEVSDDRVPNRVSDELHAAVVVGSQQSQEAQKPVGTIVAGLASTDHRLISGIKWLQHDQDLRLKIPYGSGTLRFTVWMGRLSKETDTSDVLKSLSFEEPSRNLSELTRGGPPRWPDVVKTNARLGNDDGPFAVDELTYPIVNPWLCRMRLTGHDFFSDQDRAAVCDWDGNVWLVSGLSKLDASEEETELTWRRIASGMFQPLGLRIIDDVIHVTCRDQLCRLHDLNGDDAIDWYECINNDHQVTDHFHEFAMGLQTDDDGNFYYAKSARHALTALVPHHGTLLRVSKDGSKTDILATGFRAANGVCLNPDGTFIVTDQEGHWNPKNRINWVREGGFYGNMYGYHDVTDESDDAMEQPLCWITNAFDRSPSELLWVPTGNWGPLEGRLLNLSYGYGKVYLVPHENIDGQMQGGMIELPIPQFPTGTLRGRFNPTDGQLYLSGMFAWGSNQQQNGGFYRLRYTGKPVHLPAELKAKHESVELSFSGELDAIYALNADNYTVKVWDLKRSKNYGSKHYNERELQVTDVSVNGHRVSLMIPEVSPTWCMEIRYRLKSSDGKPIEGRIHNTIHQLGE